MVGSFIFLNIILLIFRTEHADIKQFQYTNWPEDSLPDSAIGIIGLINEVKEWNKSVDNMITIVHCRYERSRH